MPGLFGALQRMSTNHVANTQRCRSHGASKERTQDGRRKASDARQSLQAITCGYIRSRRKLHGLNIQLSDETSDYLVMSDSERPSKRQRISQACDYCRKRKSKCDGTQPVCSVCRLFDKPCTYGNAKKRGLQTGYVKGLEGLLGLMIRDVPQGEVLIRSRLRHQYLNCCFTEGEFLDQTTDLWRRSDLAKDLDQLLSTHDTDLGQGWLQQSSLQPLPVFDKEQEPETIQDTILEPSVLNEPVDEGIIAPRHQDTLPHFPNEAALLVDHYFQATQCWFPIVERRDILRTLYQDSESESSQSEDVPDQGHRLCAWAIVIFSSQGKEHQSLLSQCPDLSQIQSLLWSRPMSNHESFGIGHVQASLIMALCEIRRGAFGSAWLLTAQSHRMQMVLDIQDSPMHERSQHVFQGCLYLDSVISAFLGKASFASSVACHALSCLDENGLEEWEPFKPLIQDAQTSTRSDHQPMRVLSSFNVTRSLMEKLSDILDRPIESQVFDRHVSDLQSWYSNVTKPHKLNDHSTPPILVLHLTWNFTILTLFRRVQHIERRWIPLVQQAVRSVSEISTRYLELVETSSCNPLLLIFGLQAERSLDQLHQGTNQSDISVDYLYLKKTLEMLNSSFQNESSASYPKTQFDEPVTETATILPPSRQRSDINSSHRSSNSTAWPNTEANMLLSPMSAELPQRPGAQQMHGVNSSRLSQSRLSDSHPFDDIFDEMLSYIPSRR